MAENVSVDQLPNGLALRGVVAILFGLAAIFWPGLTLVTLVYIFSAFILVSGIISLVTSIVEIGRDPYWFVSLVMGLLELAIGVYLVRHIGVSLATLILLIGIVLVVRGILEIVRAIMNRSASTHRVLAGVVGLVTLIAGLIVLREPVAGGVAFVWVLGLYALLTGTMLLAMASTARSALSTSGGRR
jgi:uncharacterized membrane protein HdeD (DUF308 family)